MALSLPSVADVRSLIDTPLPDGAVTAVINDAALMAEGCPAVSTYPSARQAAIVKWIAAHLIDQSGKASASGSGKVTSRKIGDAAETFASGTLGSGLASSSYGAQAIALDPSGCLVNLGKPRAFIKVLTK